MSFHFNLNPNDRPVLSIGAANKAQQILATLLAKQMYEQSIKTLYEKHTSKTFVKNFH